MLRTPARALAAAAMAARPALRPAAAARAPVFRAALAVPAARMFHASSFTAAPVVVKVPQMAESITEGTLKQFSKAVGDYVKADEEIATIETDKIDVSVNAPEAGKIVEFLAEEDDTVTVGQDLVKIEPGDAPAGSESESSGAPGSEGASTPSQKSSETKDGSEPTVSKGSEQPKSSEGAEGGAAKAAPSVDSAATAKAPAPKPAAKKEAAPDASKAPATGTRNETRVKMSRMRQTISTRLKASQNTAASLTTFNEIDMSSIMDFRKLYKEGVLKADGVKLGFMSAFAKASVLALREIPAANASIEGDQIVYRDYVDLSVAVATPKGLVTPVVRNAEEMGLVDFERAIADLGKKARDGKLTIEDMSGGTFTISNGGVFGSLFGTPIINHPQAAVLGMHSIKEKPVVVDGQIVIRPIMVVALTYDHRLLDGREAVTFLVRIKEYVEDPRRMLLPSPI